MNDNEIVELEAFCATKIMGWIPAKGDWWPKAVNKGGKFNCDPSEASCWCYVYDNGGIPMPDGKTYCSTKIYNWNPTNNQAAAMEVLKKCCQRAGMVMIQHLPPESPLCKQHRLEQWSLNAIGITEQGATMELAICLFARKLFQSKTN